MCRYITLTSAVGHCSLAPNNGCVHGVRRWVTFNMVGLIGAIVQLTVLSLLSWAGFGYAAATVLAVEAAVLNNFAWHRRWTWPGVRGLGAGDTLRRLVIFNLTVGLVSIVQNVGVMAVLVERFEMHHLAANTSAIALCSVANYLISQQLVFRTNVNGTERRRGFQS